MQTWALSFIIMSEVNIKNQKSLDLIWYMQYVWYMHTGVLCTCTVCRLQPSDAVFCGVPTPASRSCLGSQIITELIFNIWWGAQPKTIQSCSPRILSSFWPRTSTNRGNAAIGDWFAVTVGNHSLRATKSIAIWIAVGNMYGFSWVFFQWFSLSNLKPERLMCSVSRWLEPLQQPTHPSLEDRSQEGCHSHPGSLSLSLNLCFFSVGNW